MARRTRASSLSAQGCAVSEPPQRTRAVGGSIADRALGGALLFGYFLLGKQEKVTRSPGRASEKHRDVRRVSRNTPRAKGKELDPGFRRDDDVGGFHGMTKLGAFAGMTSWGRSSE